MDTTTDTPALPGGPATPFQLTVGERPPVVAGELALADVTPTLTLGGGFPPDRNGKPCRYWDKEAIGPGTIRDAKGVTHRLTAADVDAIVEDVGRAMSFGHEPSLPDRHFGTPGRNYGWVKGIRKNAKGNIVLTHQHVGDAENNDALNHKTSVMLRRNYTDERGRQWRWWLDHNAVIHNPQLRDLEDFKPATLAASAGGQPAPVDYVVLAADQPGADRPKETPMSLDKLRGAMGDHAKGVADDAMEGHAVAHILKCHKALKKAGVDVTALSGDGDGPEVPDYNLLLSAFTPGSVDGKSPAEVLAMAATAIPSLNGQLAATRQERDDALALSAAEPTPEPADPPMDPRLRAVLVGNVKRERQLCLSVGVPDGLLATLDTVFGEPATPNELALSAAGEDSHPAAQIVYAGLAQHWATARAATGREPPVTVRDAIARGASVAAPGKDALALASADPLDPNNTTNGADGDLDAQVERERARWHMPTPAAK